MSAAGGLAVRGDRPKLLNIQALRALAACMIVVYHCVPLMTGGFDEAHWGWTSAGVDIFFVISGYIMVYNTRFDSRPYVFAVSRIQRIVPLYWLVTLLAFFVALSFPAAMGSTKASLVDLVRSLFFIPFQKNGGRVQPILFVGWTLNLEALFYGIYTVALFSPRRAPVAAAGILAALVLIGLFLDGPITTFMTQPIMLEFAAGMMLAKRRPNWSSLTAFLAIIAGFAAFMIIEHRYRSIDHNWLRLLPAMAVVGGALSLESRKLVMSNRLVQELGGASFAIYLVHPFVTQLLTKILQHQGPAIRNAGALFALAAAGLLGILVFRCIERPIARLWR